MEKTFPLESRETSALNLLDQQRTQALAAVGALSLDMEQARKNLETTAERQRAFLQQAVISRGIEQFDNARIQNGALVVTVPDVVPTPVETGKGKAVERLNGSAADATV